jgi:hypothetical protein
VTATELVAILTAAAVLISSVASLVLAIRNADKLSATHQLVNGASEQINLLREERGRQAGVQEGLQVQRNLLQELDRPLTDAAPARGAQVLGIVPPASPDVDPMAAARNYASARRARALRERRPI